jgi:hypothetical protein
MDLHGAKRWADWLNRAIPAHEPRARTVEQAYELGWRAASDWAKRGDLISDIDSPAYLEDRRSALGPPPEATLGVGDGSGSLFVHGSFDAIKRVQSMIFELDRLRASQPPSVEPKGYLHEVTEPDGRYNRLYSQYPSNPWSHWLENYKGECKYTRTPLYDRAAQPPSAGLCCEKYQYLVCPGDKDQERLAWIGGGTLFDELCGVDVHLKAESIADMAGRDEPNEADLAEAARYVIDAAMAEDSASTKEADHAG